MKMISLVPLTSATILQSCTSLPVPKSKPVVAALPLQEVLERRNELSVQRVVIEGFLLSNKERAILKRTDEGRSLIWGKTDSCAPASGRYERLFENRTNASVSEEV